MTQETFKRTTLILLGCGKMGSAMLKGWLTKGFDPKSICVEEPMRARMYIHIYIYMYIYMYIYIYIYIY